MNRAQPCGASASAHGRANALSYAHPARQLPGARTCPSLPVGDDPGPPSRPVPMEYLQLPDGLNGSRGDNRGAASVGILMRNDLEAIGVWLSRFASRRATHASYRKEAERLLLWATIERRKPVSSLDRGDMAAYRQFLLAPQPAAVWMTAGGARLSRANPGWRPFAGPLSAPSAHQALMVIHSMFAWMIACGYLRENPLVNLARPAAPAPKPAPACPTAALWAAVIAELDAMPRTTARETERAERARWLMHLLHYGGLRPSEIEHNVMAAFTPGDHPEGRWSVALVGLDGRTYGRTVDDEFLAALRRYRHYHGLPPVPSPGERTPLVVTVGGRLQPLKRGRIDAIVKEVLAAASLRVKAQDRGQGAPDSLRSVSVRSEYGSMPRIRSC